MDPMFELSSGQVVGFLGVYAVVLLVGAAAYVTIIRKAGYSGWWALVLLVPVANLVMIVVFAFSEWPVTRELEMARAALAQQELRQPAGGQGDSRFSWGG